MLCYAMYVYIINTHDDNYCNTMRGKGEGGDWDTQTMCWAEVQIKQEEAQVNMKNMNDVNKQRKKMWEQNQRKQHTR